MMTQEQIEAVMQIVHSLRTGAMFQDHRDAAEAVVREAITALQARVDEAERERDEAREMHRVWVEEPEGLRWYMDRASERAARITELEAEVARLTHKLIDVGEMECGKCDAVGVDCGEHHPSWRWLATQARADIATLRAAIAEAVRRADNPSRYAECFSFEAAKYITEPLRNLTKPDTPSERIMSDKDRENPVEGAHPTQPEGEDALVEAVKASIEGWNNVVEMGLLPPQHHDTAKRLSDRLHTALSARGGRVVFDGSEG